MSYGMYAASVVSSKELRVWLAAQIEGKKQTDVAKEWGVEQPTISRLFKQSTYDLPLNTVSKIAGAFGYTELSAFFKQVETGVKPATGSVSIPPDGTRTPISSADEATAKAILAVGAQLVESVEKVAKRLTGARNQTAMAGAQQAIRRPAHRKIRQ